MASSRKTTRLETAAAPQASRKLEPAQRDRQTPWPARAQHARGHHARARAVTPAGLLQLQRTVGNRAVNRLIQAKLIVGPADDPYEREAERVAAQFGASTSAADRPAQHIQALPQAPAVGPEGGEAGDDIERQLAASKGAGAPLPADTRTRMETHLGADFSAVRVHTDAQADALNRQLGAQAFTHGADIYVSAGKYAPQSSEGQRLLAHELTHVTQQQAAPRLRRLMSPADFKKQTSGLLGSRSKTDFTTLDRLLDDYSKFGWAEADIPNRKAKLDQIDQAARAYAGKRKSGVNKLITSVQTELGFIGPLAEAIPDINAKTALKAAIKKLFQSQDAYLEAVRAGHPVQGNGPDFMQIFSKAQRALNELGTRAQVMRELIAEDLSRVENIAADTATHPLLRNILNEVLANKDKIYFQETQGTASGAVLAGQKERDRGITEKYRLDMQMAQAEGSPERLSSLVHEMTHIAVQETFSNTAIHLAFKRTATDQEVLDLSRTRTEQCRALKRALEETRKQWSPGQYRVLQEKTDYPVNASGKNTLTSYAEAFKKKGELTQTEYDRIVTLAGQGANNTLIEFDTVINQMMFLMTAWNVPQNNKFYAKLREVAQQAYDWRHPS
ncbi:eCIS core domain-containing protein [Candidatus Roseilinea sp. NK_OTU-006]|jgi:hypothetical protein|uniref:eCIS core domain-containing protein n=1 Tax=Candidatus Roseilinea sp. NK_OTU-006 TaxID=2704250 RepID=UPI00145C7431|nr:DUF4157 domain-containing protein [Candidatus Roseilinea sp. NK_OTU-006]